MSTNPWSFVVLGTFYLWDKCGSELSVPISNTATGMGRISQGPTQSRIGELCGNNCTSRAQPGCWGRDFTLSLSQFVWTLHITEMPGKNRCCGEGNAASKNQSFSKEQQRQDFSCEMDRTPFFSTSALQNRITRLTGPHLLMM